jgi:transposase-like protein
MSPRGPKKGTKRQTHSDESKDQVIAALRDGMTVKEVSERFAISPATINFWKKSAGLTGGKRGRTPGSKVKKDGESGASASTARSAGRSTGRPSAKALAKAYEGSITLNGEVYVPAKSIELPRNTEKVLKALSRLESELAALKEIVHAA